MPVAPVMITFWRRANHSHSPMGIDVLHAMRPQFELREDMGEIEAELVEDF